MKSSQNSLDDIRIQLQELGFQSSVIKRAIKATNSTNFDQILEYILSEQNSANSQTQQPSRVYSQNEYGQRGSEFKNQAYERRREEFMQIKLQRQQEAQKRRQDFESIKRQRMQERGFVRETMPQQQPNEKSNSPQIDHSQIERLQTNKNSPQIDHSQNDKKSNKINQSDSKLVCDSGTCEIKRNEQIYSVVCPVGQSAVEPIIQSKRLDTLEGKTIAIVGGSFMASVTHPELKHLILNEFPTSKVFVLNEIGSAGVFPGPGIRRRSVELFQAKLKELKVDAVISGNGGCGLCTPKEAGSSIAAEYIGIPSVTIAAPGFSEQVVQTSFNNGLLVSRVAVYPGAFASHSREELIKNTDTILWPQIKEALTKPITESDKIDTNSMKSIDPSQLVFNGTIDEVNLFFNEMNWSDGLPIIPPTIERINEFLKFAGIGYDSHIAVLPIAHRKTLAIHVAACGVMSGCRPEYMPILIALTKALAHPEFRRTLSSTHAWNPFCFLNGPVARQLCIDCGQGEISEESNASIGRFMNLALKNLSGYYIKQDRMGTFGYLMPFCLVEDEESLKKIGWKPYHSSIGFNENESTVTVSSTLLWGNNMAPSSSDPSKIADLISWDITERCQFALGSGKQYTYRTILLTEPVALSLSKCFDSKEKFESELIEKARRPLHERAFANYYANPGSSIDPKRLPFSQYEKQIASNEDAKLSNLPDWYALPEGSKASKIMTIPVMQKGMTAIIVTGDRARNKVQVMPGGGYGTVKIELPENWNVLMMEAGYETLEKFIINQ